MSALPLPPPGYNQSWASQLVRALEQDAARLSALAQRVSTGESVTYTASRAVVTTSAGALSTAATTATELGYVSGVTSAIQTQINTNATAISTKQPADNTLTALAALDATQGFLGQAGADTFVKRSLVAPAAGLTISNETGALGNPTFALANDLAALESLATTGTAERTGTSTWATYSVTSNSKTLLATSTNGAFRASLGLGFMAEQETINGGFWLGTDLSVVDGGTGASDAANARTNLGCGTAATANTGTSGATVPLLNGANTWSGLQRFDEAIYVVEQTSDDSLTFDTYTSAVGVSSLVSRKARGTFGTPTTVAAGDRVMTIKGVGYDGTTWDEVGTLQFRASTVSSGNLGGEFRMTLTDSAGTLQTRMLISETGATTFQGAITTTGATGGIGYATGAGGAVTQATSKATGVTLNTVSGAITMHNAALAAAAEASFTLTNSTIGANDVVVVNVKSGATASTYSVQVDAVAAGSCRICVSNWSTTSRSEAIVLQFVVIKGAIA